jgi:hypothetical protein
MPVTASGLWKKHFPTNCQSPCGFQNETHNGKWRWHHEAILRSSSRLSDGRLCFYVGQNTDARSQADGRLFFPQARLYKKVWLMGKNPQTARGAGLLPA